MIDSEHIKWHALETEAVFQRIGSSEEGLDITESKKRLKKYGFYLNQTLLISMIGMSWKSYRKKEPGNT